MIFILTFPETYGPMFCERGFLGCAVPLPCFPELTVPHTHAHAHTNVQGCPELHSSLLAAGGRDLCIHPVLWVPLEFTPCALIGFKGGRPGLAAPVPWLWTPWVQDRAQVPSKKRSCGVLGSSASAIRCHLCSCSQSGNWKRFHWKPCFPPFPHLQYISQGWVTEAMVMAGVHQGFIGLGRQNCRFHELLVAERAKTAADPATGALLLRRALCKAGERSL